MQEHALVLTQIFAFKYFKLFSTHWFIYFVLGFFVRKNLVTLLVRHYFPPGFWFGSFLLSFSACSLPRRQAGPSHPHCYPGVITTRWTPNPRHAQPLSSGNPDKPWCLHCGCGSQARGQPNTPPQSMQRTEQFKFGGGNIMIQHMMPHVIKKEEKKKSIQFSKQNSNMIHYAQFL